MMRLLGILLCLLGLSYRSVALYQDLAGTFDWHHQHVGTVLTASSSAGKPKITLISDQNLLAALHSRNGSIAWRKHMGHDERIVGSLILEKSALAVIASSSGTIIRCFDTSTGTLLWDAATGSQASAVPLLPVNLPGAQFVAAFLGSSVQLYGIETGALHWATEVELPAGSTGALLAQGEALLVVGITPGKPSAKVASVAIATGRATGSFDVHSPVALSSSSAGTSSGLAVLSADGSQLCLLAGTQVSCQALAQLSSKLPIGEGAQLQLSATAGGVLLAAAEPSQAGAALLALSGSRFTLLADSSSAAAASPEASLDSSTKAVAFVQSIHGGAGVAVTLLCTSSGQVLASSSIEAARPQAGATALPARAFLLPSRKGPAAAGLLLAWQDDLLQLLAGGQVAWAREEALAAISSSVFVDLPAEGREAEGAAMAAAQPQMDLRQQLHLQLLSFKVQFKLNSRAEAEELAQLRQQQSTKNRPTRDINGFRRMIVVSTDAGKVLALHNGDGRVLWGLNYGRGTAPSELHLWRTFHDVMHAPQLVALHLQGSQPFASIINAHTGSQIERLALAAGVTKVVPLAQSLHDGKAEQHLFMLPGSATPAGQLPVELLPGGDAAQQLLQQHYGAVYLWQQGESGLAGFGFTQAGAAAQPPVAQQVWQVQLHEQVLAVAARDAWEPAHSYVKVLGDRSMKYKYLNPSTVFVATASGGGGGITVRVLDTVTGGVLHSQAHPGGCGPVRALISEHFVVYHFFDAKATRFEVNVMELYDASPRSYSIADVLGGQAARQQEASSFAPVELEVLSQTYYLAAPLVAIAVTRTAKGITSKQVLLGTSADQVYAMDKRFLDPRRPLRKKLTAEEMEEGLVPYSDTLPLFPPMYATYDKAVLGLRSIVTAPTGLESTSLMFAHGIDMFFTRLAPAKNFDSLNDDFSFALLMVSLMALALGAGAVNYMASRAQLKQKWR